MPSSVLDSAMSETIYLSRGHPSAELLPHQELAQLAGPALAKSHRSLQYAQQLGAKPLRAALAQFLCEETQTEHRLENLCLTAGASHGLDLVATHFGKAGQTILVEEPTYFYALNIFHQHGMQTVGVPMDQEGADLDQLEQLIQTHRPALFYTIPIHHNPLGISYSPERRKKLIELAKKYDFIIIADEVYQLLSYDKIDQQPPPLRSLDIYDRVISVNAFTKILGPGLRLGWIDSAEKHLAQLTQDAILTSGGGVSPFSSAIVTAALTSGLQKQHLSRLRTVYRSRLAALVRGLEQHLPEGYRFSRPTGGYFIWVEGPENLDTDTLRQQAKDFGVLFQPGSKFSANSGCKNALRIGFSFYPEAELAEGARRLASLLASKAARG